MKYLTIVHELLQQIPELHEQLRQSRTLLSTLEQLAATLKSRHLQWMAQLAQADPTGSKMQIASAALEQALAEVEAALRPDSSTDADSPLSLDAAMAYLRRHSPPA